MRTVISLPEATAPQFADLPAPSPAPGEILIRTIAAGVNPVDLFVSSGAGRSLFGLEGPVGLGWDVAGIVEAVGSDVDGFTPGDRVAALHTRVDAPIGTHAELIAVPAGAAAPVPAGMDPVQAASVPLNSLTADQALRTLARLLEEEVQGRRLLVTGAAGGVGGYALDLAREAGWEVEGLARDTDAEYIASTGARLVTLIEPGRYDAVLDAAYLRDEALAGLRDGGALVGLIDRWRDDLPDSIRAEFIHVHHDGARLAQMLKRSEQPSFAPRIDATFPFENVTEAYRHTGRPGRRGRVVLVA